MSHRDFMNTQHPIVCLPMNRVSNIELAIAVAKAGCLPSIIMVSYSAENGKIFREEEFQKDIISFVGAVGKSNIMISMTDIFLMFHYKRIIKYVEIFGISHIEILPFYGTREQCLENLKTYVQFLINIKKLGCKIIVKCLTIPAEPVSASLLDEGIADALIVKCTKGAGKVHNVLSSDIKKATSYAKNIYPEANIIASGGVSTYADIESCLTFGAKVVGIGTMFAMSKESKICEANKKKIIAMKANDIERLQYKDSVGSNAVVFDDFIGKDDSNKSLSLEQGVNGEGGHLYMGHGIEHIDEILSVHDIVKKLTTA